MRTFVSVRAAIVLTAFFTPLLEPARSSEPAGISEHETNIRAGTGFSIVAVRKPILPSDAPSPSSSLGTGFPRPRLAGFSPLVAIATSDARREFDLEWEHVPSNAYIGFPLNPPANTNFVIGILDSGADVNLASGTAATTLGFTGDNLTINTIPIGGVGGKVDATVTQPVGYFAAGLSAVNPNGTLNLSALRGHWNVACLAAPPILCGNGETIVATVGMPFLSQYTEVIRVDTPRQVVVGGTTYKSPNVQIQATFDPTPPTAHAISMTFGGLLPVTTASYYGDFEDFITPITPTLLSFTPLSIPTGGAFFANILVREGPAGPNNPPITVRLLVDTGAQSSIISPAVAANLNLPFEPDFTVDVCGVGGLVTDVPGYYIDYVRMNALGGALEYSRAPFVMLDLPSPEGGTLDGILGMNFFWNRNVILQPRISSSAFIRVSAPIAVPYGDNDVDFDVDADDSNFYFGCLTPAGVDAVSPECTHLDYDEDGDIDMADFARLQRCFSGADIPANVNCAAE